MSERACDRRPDATVALVALIDHLRQCNNARVARWAALLRADGGGPIQQQPGRSAKAPAPPVSPVK